MSLSLKTALHNHGWEGQLLAHHMNWFQDGKPHKVTRYNSKDSAAIKSILQICKASDIDGLICTWFGLTDGFINEATQETCRQCEAMGLKFALLLDPWAAKMGTKTKEQALIDSINDYSTLTMLNSKAYIKEKAILDFSTGADFSKIVPHVPHDIKFWFRHQHYSWPETTNTLAVLKRDNANPGMKIPAICLSFFDGGALRKDGTRNWNSSVWSPAQEPALGNTILVDAPQSTRVIPHEAGNFFHDTVALVPKTAPMAGLVSLSDFDEDTGALAWLSALAGIRVGA